MKTRTRLAVPTLFLAVIVGAVLIAAVGCRGTDLPPTELPSESETVSPTQATQAPPTPTPTTARASGDPQAPEIQGIASWINSEPLALSELRGKVVLIDFWTYTCVNCIRTFPYLAEWHSKYADKGLVIIGIHTPEFEFEKNRDNVIAATKEHGLLYPVAQDNDFGTWRAFQNRFWPAKYLIDKDGFIRYRHFGEGAYDETEREIRALLEETGISVTNIIPGSDSGPRFDPRARSEDRKTSLTRELYAGYERNYASQGAYVAHKEYYDGPDREVLYNDRGEHLNHFIYLQGLWRNGPESIIHARETEDFEDYVALMFHATSVNVVINPDDSTPFELVLTLDGRPLTEEEKGADVVIDEEGRSYVLVDGPRMYRLVELPMYGGHDLTLSANSTAFALFAFTFGAYPEGP